MKKKITYHLLFWLSLIVSFIQTKTEAYASHAQSADLTYKCLGGNQYELSLSFYRDCAGVNAPASVPINLSSLSCNQNLTTTLYPIPGTGIEVTPICANVQTQCSNGNYPGVQEYIYRGIVTLPAQCTDWVFSFTLCCRNAAINNIQNPSSENIYVEAKLNNLNFNCNSSPTFSNAPIPFVCVGQNYCFNHGATDTDGDSLVYSLVAPATGPGTTVTYLPGYSATQPIKSNPLITFNNLTGDICMTPTQLEVGVLSVLVEEYRSGVFVGSVVRDIQLRTITCTNSNPYILGINGNGQYSLTACAGSNINFTIPTFDADVPQVVTITWNNAIQNATFTDNGGNRPTATFNWTPGQNDISNVPHCFTVTVMDDNCPYKGSQTFSFCITVTGLTIGLTSVNANCGASNGSATATVSGGTAPYTYQWIPNGGNNAIAHGLQAGTYTVNITDANGCMGSDTITVGSNGSNANLNVTFTDVTCAGSNNGTATVTANGGHQPYTYLWSNGAATASVSGLAPGTYTVTVTTSNGCTSTDSVVISEPAALVVSNLAVNNATCYAGNNGSATVTLAGGTPPYSYSWNTVPPQFTATATGLGAGNYLLSASDAYGCSISQSVVVTEPPALNANAVAVSQVSCYGGSNGSASVLVSGGTQPYSYAWNTIPVQNTQVATNLSAGMYGVTITDNNNCTYSTTVQISQPSALNAFISNSASPGCFGGNDGTATVTVSGGLQPYNYSWNTNPAQNTATATGLSAGTYSCAVTDNNGCTVNVNITIGQPTAVTASVNTFTNVSCNGGNNGSATASGTGGSPPYTFQWNTNPVQYTATAASLPAGTYTVTVTDVKGCTAQSTVLITEPSAVVTGASGAVTICPGQSAMINATATGGSGGYTFLWNNNLGFGATKTVSPNVTTTYMVTAYDANGCMGSTASVVVTVNSILAVTFEVSDHGSICEGDAATVSASVSGGIGQYQFSWNQGLGNGPGPFTVHPIVTTYYTVTLTDVCGNSRKDSVLIEVHPLPLISLVPLSGESCGQVTLDFANNAPHVPGSMYQWNFSDNTVSYQQKPQKVFAHSGHYEIRLTVTSSYGCVSSKTTWCDVAVDPQSKAAFKVPHHEVSYLEPRVEFVNLSTDATDFLWDFGDGQTSTEKHPVHTYAEKGTYRVKLECNNKFGCNDTVSDVVSVVPEFTYYIPNAFTPEGDGKNEVFNGKGLEIKEFSMSIFNRWGELVFNTKNAEEGWDGKTNYSSRVSQNDLYVYLIEITDVKDKFHTYQGTVALLK